MDNPLTPPVDPPSAAERPPFNEVSVLFPILTLCTAAYLALLVAEFFLHGGVRVAAIMMPVYVTLLGAVHLRVS